MVTDSNFYDVDVAIVGGGPGGVSSAFVLLNNGYSVALIDRKEQHDIGNKVCGDALSPSYYQELNKTYNLPMPSEESVELCDQVVIASKNDARLTVPSFSGTVNRLEYGQKLLNTLLEFDKFILLDSTMFYQPIIEQNENGIDFLTGLVCKHGKEEYVIRSKVTIDASGTNSVVRSKLPPSLVNKMGSKTELSKRYIAYREILEFDKPHDYQRALYISNQEELKELGAAYYWIFSKGPTTVNVGLGYLLNEHNRGHHIDKLNESITRKLFPDGTVVASQGDQIPARLPLHSVVANGFVVVGDAAGLANPLNGEGHAAALESGCYTGQFLSDKLSDENISERGLWGLNLYIWHKYGKLFSWGIALIKLMHNYGADLFDKVIEKHIITQDEVNAIVNDPDANISIISILKRGWKNPGLLLNLFKAKRFADKLRGFADNYPSDPDYFDTWSEQLNKIESYY